MVSRVAITSGTMLSNVLAVIQLKSALVTNAEACAWEIEWIAREKTYRFGQEHHQHNTDDIGCNFTPGGDGALGHTKTLQSRIKIAMGWTEERRQQASKRMRMSNPMKVKETAKRVTKQLAKYWTGREWSIEHKKNARKSKLGKLNSNYGKPQSEAAKQKNREANRQRAFERTKRKMNDK